MAASSINMGSQERTTYIMGISCEEMKKAESSLDNYVLVWLEPALVDDTSSFGVSIGLQTSIREVRKFNDVQQCLHYLTTVTEKRVFLVLSFQIDDAHLQNFQHLPQIEYIYAFGRESIFKSEQSKLVRVTTIPDLISRLSSDIRLCEGDDDTEFVSLGSSTSPLLHGFKEAGDAKLFIFYQLVLEILLHHPKTPAIEQQFMSFCEEINQQKPEELNALDEFRKTYHPSQAIKWYTRPCFLHRIFNRSCRIGDMKSMFKLVFFMADLYAQLNSLHQENFHLFAERIYVYRGRPMLVAEFDKMQKSIKNLVVTKSFLSTTTKYDVAYMYSGGSSTVPGIVPAILKMIVCKQRNESKPFAFIREGSSVKYDDEVLMSIGMVFRLTESNYRNGVQEFTLLRGDEEEQVEREIRNACFGRELKSDMTSDLDALICTAQNDSNLRECGIEMLTATAKIDEKNIGTPNASTMKETETDSSTPFSLSSPNVHRPTSRYALIWREMVLLKKGVDGLFILDSDPTNLDRSIEVPFGFPSSEREESIIIKGRILPTTYPFNQRSFNLEIVLRPDFPFSEPLFRIPNAMYHPNVNEYGRLCVELIYHVPNSWHSGTSSIASFVKAIVKLVDKPRIDDALVPKIANEYLNNYTEFEKKALQCVLSFGASRS